MSELHRCNACGVIFPKQYELCQACVMAYAVGKNETEVTWRDTEKVLTEELHAAMSPIEAKIRDLCKNNDLLGEIIATLSIPRNQESFPPQLIEIVEVWKKRRIK